MADIWIAADVTVMTNGQTFVLLGRPEDEGVVPEDHPDAHNCDAMGCGSAGPHILQRCKVQGAWAEGMMQRSQAMVIERSPAPDEEG